MKLLSTHTARLQTVKVVLHTTLPSVGFATGCANATFQRVEPRKRAQKQLPILFTPTISSVVLKQTIRICDADLQYGAHANYAVQLSDYYTVRGFESVGSSHQNKVLMSLNQNFLRPSIDQCCFDLNANQKQNDGKATRLVSKMASNSCLLNE